MLTRSVVFTTNGLKPNSLAQGAIVQKVFSTMVTLQIQKTILAKAYGHLHVAYNYDIQRPDYSEGNIFNVQFSTEEELEVRNIHYLVGVAVQDLIEEFHLFVKTNPNLVLNFNSCLLNRFNFILSVEVLPL